MKTRITLTFALLGALLALQTGCAAIINWQLNGKVAPKKADSFSVVVNIPAIGGGSLEVKNLGPVNGRRVAGEFREQVNTPSGSVKIDGVNVDLGVAK